MEHRGTLREITREFLRLGFVAYGGHAAHIAMMEERFVRQRGWVTRERFMDMIGAVNLLAEPTSTELTIYLGEIRGGVPGLITAGFLPKLRQSPVASAFLDGVNAAAVALMAFVGWQFARASLVNAPAVILAIASAVLVFRYKINSAWLVLGGAIAGVVLHALRFI